METRGDGLHDAKHWIIHVDLIFCAKDTTTAVSLFFLRQVQSGIKIIILKKNYSDLYTMKPDKSFRLG